MTVLSGGLGADAALLGLARSLRAAGVDASTERVHAFLCAVDVLRPGMRADVYWAGRLTLCGDRDDLARYERVFAAYFGEGERAGRPVTPPPPSRPRLVVSGGTGSATRAEHEHEAPPTASLASTAEQLRHRDVADLDAAEREQVRRLLAAFALSGRTRRTARRSPARRGAVDRTARYGSCCGAAASPHGCDGTRGPSAPAAMVLLVDVSGSMARTPTRSSGSRTRPPGAAVRRCSRSAPG